MLHQRFSNFEIQTYFRNEAKLNGVYSRNKLCNSNLS